ncbi:hypothetical protein TRVA0_012S03092 [Trichomonascus vanleenenianus]|uniref:uncharacterized protein n=1 Tax=Trichomonascus vanleenenianus TaxID=2268995 RepID=UPI003ECB1A77
MYSADVKSDFPSQGELSRLKQQTSELLDSVTNKSAPESQASKPLAPFATDITSFFGELKQSSEGQEAPIYPFGSAFDLIDCQEPTKEQMSERVKTLLDTHPIQYMLRLQECETPEELRDRWLTQEEFNYHLPAPPTHSGELEFMLPHSRLIEYLELIRYQVWRHQIISDYHDKTSDIYFMPEYSDLNRSHFLAYKTFNYEKLYLRVMSEHYNLCCDERISKHVHETTNVMARILKDTPLNRHYVKRLFEFAHRSARDMGSMTDLKHNLFAQATH